MDESEGRHEGSDESEEEDWKEVEGECMKEREYGWKMDDKRGVHEVDVMKRVMWRWCKEKDEKGVRQSVGEGTNVRKRRRRRRRRRKNKKCGKISCRGMREMERMWRDRRGRRGGLVEELRRRGEGGEEVHGEGQGRGE